METKEVNKSQEEIKEKVEETAEFLEKRLAEAEAKRLELLKARLNKLEAENKQLEIENKETEEAQQYIFPKAPVVEQVSELDKIKQQYDSVARAVEEGFPVNHPARSIENREYNGVNKVDGYLRYIKGEKIEDIFK